MVWTGVLYLLLRYLLNSNFSLTELGATVTRLSGLALLPLFVLGIVGRFVVGLLFVQRYAMTKEEIQAEAQESEVRPEFRRARSQ
jgi:flagellar biosynthesis protein FlhB